MRSGQQIVTIFSCFIANSNAEGQREGFVVKQGGFTADIDQFIRKLGNITHFIVVTDQHELRAFNTAQILIGSEPLADFIDDLLQDLIGHGIAETVDNILEVIDADEKHHW